MEGGCGQADRQREELRRRPPPCWPRADIADVEKGDAAALLAFCSARRGDPQAETRWIVDYFDTYRAADCGFVFLDLITQSDVIGYLNGWRVKYPWIRGISLIKGVGDDVIMPEGILPLAIEMANPGYYKFSENGNVIKAGLFNPGFNVIALDANALFLASGRHTYRLEVRSADLILTREIALDVDVPGPAPAGPAVPGPDGQSAGIQADALHRRQARPDEPEDDPNHPPTITSSRRTYTDSSPTTCSTGTNPTRSTRSTSSRPSARSTAYSRTF